MPDTGPRDPSSRNPQERSLILAARLFDGEDLLDARAIEIADGRIAAVHEPGLRPSGLKELTLPQDAVLAPGFIDLQVNGGGGVLLNDAPTADAIRRIAAAHRAFGTTGLLPTLITDAPERMRALALAAPEALAVPGVLGFHLEGPFINPARPGIHDPRFIRRPEADDLVLLERFGKFGRSLVTLAPELWSAPDLRRLAASGLTLCAGHSEAGADRMREAAAAGITGVTHLFNAMSQIGPREPGLVGAALGLDKLRAGIICDGVHVDPLNLALAFRAMGPDRLMLVTDAMALAASERDGFLLQGRPITLSEGRLTGPDGTLAGAHLTMIEAVRNARAMMGASLEEALAMASRTPARFLGLGASHGRIAPGFAADLVAIDPDARRVHGTAIAGQWQNGPAG